MTRQEPDHQISVVDGTMDKVITRRLRQPRQIVCISGIGQKIEINDNVSGSDRADDEIAADKSGAARDEEGSHTALLLPSIK